MRLRLGLLRDPVAIEKHTQRTEAAERERRHAEALRKMKEAEAIYPGFTATVSSNIPAPPPVTDASQAAEKAGKAEKAAKPPAQRIRPLSEAKAIDAGANFISEGFLFAVAGALILLEQLRSRRKEANRRDEITERLDLLETRNRQDIERLEALEERDRRNEERILQLEEEHWRIKGGKGEFPGRKEMQYIKVYEPSPLWEAPAKATAGFWRDVWQSVTGPKEKDLEKGEVVLAKEGKEATEDAVPEAADRTPTPTSRPNAPEIKPRAGF